MLFRSKEAVFTFPQNISEAEKSSLIESSQFPTEYRLQQVQKAMWAGADIEKMYQVTKIDRWFLRQIELINETARDIRDALELDSEVLTSAKSYGFSDQQIGLLRGIPEAEVRKMRHQLNIRPVYKTVDTCAAEFEAFTPYHYSSYEDETEVRSRTKPAVIILGSGPNRIGQGIEFDYSCVHASFTLREADFETVMINCNPETVSTDYDTSDRLYFEPLTLEDVLEVVHAEDRKSTRLNSSH